MNFKKGNERKFSIVKNFTNTLEKHEKNFSVYSINPLNGSESVVLRKFLTLGGYKVKNIPNRVLVVALKNSGYAIEKKINSGQSIVIFNKDWIKTSGVLSSTLNKKIRSKLALTCISADGKLINNPDFLEYIKQFGSMDSLYGGLGQRILAPVNLLKKCLEEIAKIDIVAVK